LVESYQEGGRCKTLTIDLSEEEEEEEEGLDQHYKETARRI